MSAITPEIAKGILENPDFVRKMGEAKSNDQVKEALTGAGLTPEQVAEIMKKSETLDESALENVSGGIGVFDNVVNYVKQNPYKVARDVVATVCTIGVLTYGAKQLSNINTSIGALKPDGKPPEGGGGGAQAPKAEQKEEVKSEATMTAQMGTST